MSSHYNHLTYKLKERIYENNDKTIIIFKTRKKQTIKYIAVKAYSKKDHEGTYDKEYKILKTITHPSIIKVLGSAEDKFNLEKQNKQLLRKSNKNGKYTIIIRFKKIT